MFGIARAYTLAFRSLARPVVLAHFIWPPIAAALAWFALGYACWDRVAHAIAALLAPAQAAQAAIAVAVKVTLYLISVPFALVTAIVILETVALSFILDHVGRREYPGLERRHGGSLRESLRNTLVSAAIAAALAAISVPLWLVPGAGAAISVMLSSWLNYRSFRYDVLMSHADKAELVALPREHRAQLLLIALGTGLLTLVPVANLLSVPLAGLAFAHYLLHALDQKRRAAPRPSPQP